MKKIFLVIPALILLAGCGGTTTPEPVSEPDFISYLSAIREDGGILGQYATDEELIKLGAGACAEFEDGATFLDLASSIPVRNDEEKAFVSSQIAASLAFLCPEYAESAQGN